MKDIIWKGDMNGASAWEYLGTVVQNGVRYVALCPLDGTGRACFFRCDADSYRRVADADMERALSWRFSQVEMEAAGNRLREAR